MRSLGSLRFRGHFAGYGVTRARRFMAGGSDLEHTENATFLFCRLTSRQLGFFADGKLRRISAAGGPVQQLADAPVGRGGSWGSRRVILFAPDARGPLMQIPETGGSPQVATTFDSDSGAAAPTASHASSPTDVTSVCWR